MKSIISKKAVHMGRIITAFCMALCCGTLMASDSDTVVAPTVETVAEIAATTVGETSSINSLDTVWVLLAAILVFFMQPGFTLVETGFTRTKNTVNILMKNCIDFMAGSVVYWVLGFSIMYGTGSFMGWDGFFFIGSDSNVPAECMFMFQTVFCATAATIVSGAMAERTKFSMYVVYSVVISAIIYPISGHWTWGGGWLSQMGFHDFAGSAIVHSVGGWISLVGAIFLGPRIGKYSKDGKPRAIPGHSLTLAALGVFILWMGWFGFNPGSQLAASGSANATAISHVMVTTNLAAACGGLIVVVLSWIIYKKPSLSMMLNGILAGLVGITAGCDMVSIGGSAAIGILCGALMFFAVNFIDKVCKVDDPVGAISVHGVCGTVGTLLVGVFATDGGLLYSGSFKLLGVQAIGAFTIAGWAILCATILFTIICKTHGLRVEHRIEEEGLDIYEHGEAAYN